jgi:glutamate synthase (NADPH/NADH) small chain
MGKRTGFLEYRREPPPERPPLARLRDFSEEHPALAEETLRRQGARCMDCGVPFCHTGTLLGGLASGCPVHNLIPEWNDLVYRGQWREANLRLHQTNNFPELTGRVCPAPCEGACVLGLHDPPVTIKSLECAIVDRAFAEGWIVPEPPLRRTRKKVAIVGSGPAGLAAAAELNRMGHTVTVFERADRVGGLLMYGIPNMKLDKRLVDRRVGLLEAEGIRFITHTEVGKHFAASCLVTDFDAAVLCGGASKARDLVVPGRSLKGIRLAMEFLRSNTKSLLDSNHEDGRYISARGKDVIVIGGGDTGTDCVGTALRHGPKSLAELEILPRPPDARAPDNPWPQWPKTYRMDYAQEEALAVQGADPRLYSILTKRFTGDAAGHVRVLHTIDVEWVQENGRFGPREIPGTEREWPVDLVILALGFLGPEKEGLLAELGARTDERGNVAVDEGHMTSVPGVFAAGDMVRGQSLVVWAIREGREAARGVEEFLVYG